MHCKCDLLAVPPLQRLPKTGQKTKLIYTSETIYSSEAEETETEPEKTETEPEETDLEISFHVRMKPLQSE